MKKRLPAILLTAAMLLTLLTTAALAEDVADEAAEAETAAAETTETETDGAAAETTAAASSGTCGDNLTWVLDDAGTLTISGTGAMTDYATAKAVPWYTRRGSIKKVVLSDGITSIGKGAFEACGSLPEIAIPDSVTSIGEYAFYSCTGLTNLTIPDSVTSIGSDAFLRCSGLENVTIGNGVTALDGFKFSFNTNLKHVTIGNGVTNIDDGLFYECSSLETVVIGNSVTNLEYHAFYACSSLTSITIGSSVANIEYAAFEGCAGLTTVVYTGEEKNWDSIEIHDRNDCLIAAARNTVHSYTDTHFDATCVNCGYVVHTCACGSTYTETEETEKPAAGHHYVKSADGQWVCSVCGAEGYAFRLDNLSEHNYDNDVWSSIVNSYLAETSAGKLLTIWSSGGCVLNVETRNSAGTLESSRQIVLDYPDFAGFYEGEDAYYVACGQENPDEDDRCAVLCVIKYSKSWTRQGSAVLHGANTYIPFDGGSLRMTEAAGKLYVYTCHEMYEKAYGVHHQANLTMVADEDTMEIVDSCYIVSNSSDGYVSHSFNQFIQTDGAYVYRADHGDAYPRGIYLSKCSVDGSVMDVSYCEPYEIPGSCIETGISVGGMELSANNVLIAADSVDFTDESDYNLYGQRNIMLTVTDKNLEATNLVWLTNYTGTEGITVSTPFLVKLADDRFMLLWEESKNYSVTCVKEVITDENGKVLYTAALQNYRLSDCQPVVAADGNVRWFTRDDFDNTTIYQIAAAHTWDAGRLVQPVTDTQDGLVVYTCSNCGGTRTVTLPAGGSAFIDVQNTDDYYYEPVLWAAANGIVYGTSDFEFSPNVSCTRAQVVTFLYRAAGEPAVSGTNPFTDVSSGEYYYDAVRWGYQNGIVYGTSDTTFSPDAKVTRAQFITFLYRFAKEPTPSGAASPFKDVPSGEYYTDAVLWGYENGIVYGTSDTTFAPNDSCTRAQVVTFLYRYMAEK